MTEFRQPLSKCHRNTKGSTTLDQLHLIAWYDQFARPVVRDGVILDDNQTGCQQPE